MPKLTITIFLYHETSQRVIAELRKEYGLTAGKTISKTDGEAQIEFTGPRPNLTRMVKELEM